MPNNADRSICWRNLREAMVEAKLARSTELRDARLDDVGRWADRLAESAVNEGPEFSTGSYYIDAAMEDTSRIGWVIPL